MAVPTPPSVELPDVPVGDRALADAELALLGVLPPAHVLGGPLSRPDPDGPSGDGGIPGAGGPTDAPQSGHPPRPTGTHRRVLVRVPHAVAQAVLDAGGGLLRDDEHTPLAELSDVRSTGAGATTGTSAVVLDAALTRRRTRESGDGARDALSTSDLEPREVPRSLLVLGRPPSDADLEALSVLDSFEEVLVVVPVSSAPGSADVPTSVLRSAAHELGRGALAGRSLVRTAPLAWRDPDSDTALVASLASALGAVQTVHLRADGDDPAAKAWRSVRQQLDRGVDGPLQGVSAATEAALRRWRPPRAHRGLVVMFTGLSGSGKSTLARDVGEQVLERTARTLSLLDGDVVRTMLSSGLGFDRASRILNVRRIGYVGAEIARHGGMALCAPIAPYASTRAEVRDMVQAVGDFVLVHVSTPLEVCESRDLKGLYARARAGLIPEFTGISDLYDVPLDADLRIDTSAMSRESARELVLAHLVDGGWLTRQATGAHEQKGQAVSDVSRREQT